MTTLFYDLGLEEVGRRLREWGEPPYRAEQIWRGIYQRLLESPAELSDLPLSLRRRLEGEFSFQSATVIGLARSSDGGTEKVLLSFTDGVRAEAVLMRYDRRRTACISSQAGCAMGCVFCATGQMGFLRNLTPGEIVEQVLFFGRRLAAAEQAGSPDPARLVRRAKEVGAGPFVPTNGIRRAVPGGTAADERLTNIVIMGMGEPFHNYEATMEAIDRINHPKALGMGARRVTLSTVGIVPGIERFTQEKRQVNLAVSLHAATNELRDSLLPVNRRYPLEVLIPACRQYTETTRRRLSFEWALIRDVNDGTEQARALGSLVKDLHCHVNLIPLNPTEGFAGGAATRERAAAFSEVLSGYGISCTVRVRRGIDIQAGCGQLAAGVHPRVSTSEVA